MNDHWEVDTTHDGQKTTEKFTFLIGGAGALHRPLIPKFPGLEKFKGEKWHSAQWRHDVPLEGTFNRSASRFFCRSRKDVHGLTCGFRKKGRTDWYRCIGRTNFENSEPKMQSSLGVRQKNSRFENDLKRSLLKH